MLANTLELMGTESDVASPIDANGIDKVVHEYKPTHVIIHALWVTPDKIGELCRRHPNVSWNIRIHSKPPFLAMEGIASEWIAAYSGVQIAHRNLWLSANSEETNELMNDVFGARSLMLPNTYVKPDPPDGPTAGIRIDDEHLNIACFGAIRPLKNHYAQAAAAIMYANNCGRKLNFHVNKGREEQGGDRVTRNLTKLFDASGGHRLVEHP